ncbi:MAG TPA: class F sortase [Arthrobacter sp.]|nr:class F sortase [Arthrobacter sp.]
MPQDRRRHAAPGRRITIWQQWNKGDLAILCCGVLTFLSFTAGAPLFHEAPQLTVPGISASAPGIRAAAAPAGAAAPMAGTGMPQASATAGAQLQPVENPAPAGPVLPPAAQPIHIRYPAAAFDVPIHTLDLDGEAQASRTIEPPATKDGYWLSAFGTPGQGSGNTTYVIGHSWDGADAPFNHLSSAAAVGDRFDVETAAGTISYHVDSVATYVKSGLKDSAVWDMVPNRLVLISCFTEDPWGKNVVVTASPAAP